MLQRIAYVPLHTWSPVALIAHIRQQLNIPHLTDHIGTHYHTYSLYSHRQHKNIIICYPVNSTINNVIEIVVSRTKEKVIKIEQSFNRPNFSLFK